MSEPAPAAGFSLSGNPLSRRSFMKRTGAASVADLIAGTLLQENASATEGSGDWHFEIVKGEYDSGDVVIGSGPATVHFDLKLTLSADKKRYSVKSTSYVQEGGYFTRDEIRTSGVWDGEDQRFETGRGDNEDGENGLTSNLDFDVGEPRADGEIRIYAGVAAGVGESIHMISFNMSTSSEEGVSAGAEFEHADASATLHGYVSVKNVYE